MKTFLFLILLITFCLATPVIYTSQTATIGYAGSNITVYGATFYDNYYNTTYCDWYSYGSFKAIYVNQNQVKCLIPSYATESYEIFKIANSIQYSQYTEYSNPITLHIYSSSSSLMISSISPSEPSSGEALYVNLSHGSFLSSSTTQNRCKFYYGTYYINNPLYYVNSTSGYCYVPYTKLKYMDIAVSANGGTTWSNSLSFNFRQIYVSSISPTQGTTSTSVNLYGYQFSASKTYLCAFADYMNTNYNKTVYASFVATSNIRCYVPSLSKSTYYNVYVSDDSGYHWSLFSGSSFYYTSTQPQTQLPVVNTGNYYDTSLSSNRLSGYYFTTSTTCKIITSTDRSPYTYGTSVTVTYSSSNYLYIYFSSSYLSSSTSYSIVCSNDGTTYSIPQSITFIPYLSYTSSYSVSSYQSITIYGSGFSNNLNPTCRIRKSGGYNYQTLTTTVNSWTSVLAYLPSLKDGSSYVITCSNDQNQYSSSSVTIRTYDSFNTMAIWLPFVVIGASFFVFLLILGCVVRYRRRKSQQQNQSLVSPLENHQIELESIDNEINPQTQQTNQVYFPVQQVNQMPMFGYPQPVQFIQQPIQQPQLFVQQPNLGSNQIQVYPNSSLQQYPLINNVYPLSTQSYLPQQPLSSQGFVPQQSISQSYLLDEYSSNREENQNQNQNQN